MREAEELCPTGAITVEELTTDGDGLPRPGSPRPGRRRGRCCASASIRIPPGCPTPLAGAPDADRAVLPAIVDATADLVCAFKPQIAYFAAQRAEPQLERSARYIRERYPDVVLVLDAKRGDIGSTAEHYAREAFDRYGADAVTVNPYLGTDAATPVPRARRRARLCRTSNPGGGDLQDLDVDGTPLYQRVATMVADAWAELGECGLVVGATYPGELAEVRAIVGDLPILVPGVGAQGGDLDAVGARRLDRPRHGPDRQLVAGRSSTRRVEPTSPTRPGPTAIATRDAIRACPDLGGFRDVETIPPRSASGRIPPSGSQAVRVVTLRMPGGGAAPRRRRPARSSVGAISIDRRAGLLGPADVHVGDVHAGVAEERADGADHAGPVVVRDHQHVVGGRHVEGVVVDHHDALLAAASGQRAAQRVPAAGDRDQVDVVGRVRRADLAHVDAVTRAPAAAR